MTEPYMLAPRLDLTASQGLVTHLLSVPKGQAIILDASAVTHMGALCTQALIAAGISSKESGGSLQITNASERVENQLGSMGLSLDAIMGGQS